jgi:hypothetical protein
MPFETDWPRLERGTGRQLTLEREGRGNRVGLIAYVWLAFYVLAVAGPLLSQHFAAVPVATTNTPKPILPAPSR